jgi:rRNA-processing protein EBP2
MAKIKDRLIYETKKMDAVERRKSNKEQTAMAKERHAFRLSEKAKAKRAHMSELNDWKKSAERGRGGLAGRVRDQDDDDDRLRGMGGGGGSGVGGKRASADRRYGFGGKQRGRFKQNDRATLNDMSGFKPRGGFGGVGQKSPGGPPGGKGGKKRGGGGGGGGGNKRPGKRARDASRSR